MLKYTEPSKFLFLTKYTFCGWDIYKEINVYKHWAVVMEFKYLYLQPKNVLVSRLNKDRFQTSLEVNSTSVDLTMETDWTLYYDKSQHLLFHLCWVIFFSFGELPRCFVNMIPIYKSCFYIVAEWCPNSETLRLI